MGNEGQSYQTREERAASLAQLQQEIITFFDHFGTLTTTINPARSADISIPLLAVDAEKLRSKPGTFQHHVAHLFPLYEATAAAAENNPTQKMLVDEILPCLTQAGRICREFTDELEKNPAAIKHLNALQDGYDSIIQLLNLLTLPFHNGQKIIAPVKKLPSISEFKSAWRDVFTQLTEPEPAHLKSNGRPAYTNPRASMKMVEITPAGVRYEDPHAIIFIDPPEQAENEPDIVTKPLIPKPSNGFKRRLKLEEIDCEAVRALITGCYFHVSNIITKSKDDAEESPDLAKARKTLQYLCTTITKMLDPITPNMLVEREEIKALQDKIVDVDAFEPYRDQMAMIAEDLQQSIARRDREIEQTKPEILHAVAIGPLREINRIFTRAAKPETGQKLFSKTDTNKAAFIEDYKKLLKTLGIDTKKEPNHWR